MSRQFDEYMADKFELYGELHHLVDPSNLNELMEALETRDLIQQGINSLMHDEDDSGLQDILREQEDLIQGYVESLGEFDNSQLSANITFLAKKYGMRIGDLERLLGISAGYISRTAKENSGKRMSIDVVWKIAQLFEVGVNTLINTEMSLPNKDSDVVAQFLHKLDADTRDWHIKWVNRGGKGRELDDRFVSMELVTRSNDVLLYEFEHFGAETELIVSDDIVASPRFSGTKDLVIVPFRARESDSTQFGYDFLLVWKEGQKWMWDSMFSTADDPYNNIRLQANLLYKSIKDTQFEMHVSQNTRSIIAGYLQ